MSARFTFAALAVVGVPLLLVAYITAVEGGLKALPRAVERGLRPWLWLGPALAFLLVFLVYPSVRTVQLSFLGPDSTGFVALTNYRSVFTSADTLLAMRNNLLWLVVFTGLSVGFGLLAAVLADRVPYEPLAKALIFLPMAISFVAAGVIWRLMYDYQPPGAPQTGTLNALLTALAPGFAPRAWLVNQPWNNLALIVAGAWVWTGFCLVILSAGLKGIPGEVIEAARVDGAGEWQVFWRVILPLLGPTVAVVATTMIINALKAFDVVYVMTNGNFNTDVIANLMYKQMFNFRDFGRASAIAVALLAAIVPVMLFNLRRLKQQEAIGQ